ncbi:MAG: hypothetical protein H6707_04580 [Deltaproteobacteria bacterium]|nr:hypothetical protein [Deltaproteobacteria bacterium]
MRRHYLHACLVLAASISGGCSSDTYHQQTSDAATINGTARDGATLRTDDSRVWDQRRPVADGSIDRSPLDAGPSTDQSYASDSSSAQLDSQRTPPTCGEVLTCVYLACPPGDKPCHNSCYANAGSPAGDLARSVVDCNERLANDKTCATACSGATPQLCQRCEAICKPDADACARHSGIAIPDGGFNIDGAVWPDGHLVNDAMPTPDATQTD